MWAVQFSDGGIPQDPVLFVSEADARRYFAEVAVANDLEWTDDCSGEWIGNDDEEVRLFGPVVSWETLAPPMRSVWNHEKGAFDEVPFTETDAAEVERILAKIRED